MLKVSLFDYNVNMGKSNICHIGGWSRAACSALVFLTIPLGVALGQEQELDGQRKPDKQSVEDFKKPVLVGPLLEFKEISPLQHCFTT